MIPGGVGQSLKPLQDGVLSHVIVKEGLQRRWGVRLDPFDGVADVAQVASLTLGRPSQGNRTRLDSPRGRRVMPDFDHVDRTAELLFQVHGQPTSLSTSHPETRPRPASRRQGPQTGQVWREAFRMREAARTSWTASGFASNSSEPATSVAYRRPSGPVS